MKRRDYLKTCTAFISSFFLPREEKIIPPINELTHKIPIDKWTNYPVKITAMMVQCDKQLDATDLNKLVYIGENGLATTKPTKQKPVGIVLAFSDNINPYFCMVHLNES